MLIAFPEDSSPSDIYDLVSLVGCSYSTLPPITTMYPYGHAPSTGCWESAFGCWYVHHITFDYPCCPPNSQMLKNGTDVCGLVLVQRTSHTTSS